MTPNFAILEDTVLIGDFARRAKYILDVARQHHLYLKPAEVTFLIAITPQTPVDICTEMRLTRLEEAIIDDLPEQTRH